MAYQPINLAKNEVKKINLELQRLNNELKEMEERIRVTNSATVNQTAEQEMLTIRIDVLEEKVTSLMAENDELRNNHNSVVQELNNVIELLNESYGGIING